MIAKGPFDAESFEQADCRTHSLVIFAHSILLLISSMHRLQEGYSGTGLLFKNRAYQLPSRISSASILCRDRGHGATKVPGEVHVQSDEAPQF